MDLRVVLRYNMPLSGLMDNLCSKGVILRNFRSIVGLPRWLAIFKFNQTWYVTSLPTGDYCCGARKFWLPFVFFERKIVCK